MLDKKTYSRTKHKGFTLIEVLIAMFVLSVGMLGSTALMLQGRAEAKKINYDGKAMQLAMGMAEQMRANIEGVRAGNYSGVDTATVTDPGCIATTCSVSDMAQYDSFIWGQALENLPEGEGTVALEIANVVDDALFTITVSWTETQKDVGSSTTGSEVTKEYVMLFQP